MRRTIAHELARVLLMLIAAFAMVACTTTNESIAEEDGDPQASGASESIQYHYWTELAYLSSDLQLTWNRLDRPGMLGVTHLTSLNFEQALPANSADKPWTKTKLIFDLDKGAKCTDKPYVLFATFPAPLGSSVPGNSSCQATGTLSGSTIDVKDQVTCTPQNGDENLTPMAFGLWIADPSDECVPHIVTLTVDLER
jgi:hypothetical protein